MKYKVDKKIIILDLIIIFLLAVLDQVSKKLAVAKLMGKADFDIIKGALSLHYLENRGAAFGVFQDKQIMFLIVGVVFVVAALVMLVIIPTKRKYTVLRCAILLITSGAIGNMIDRSILNYVVDFIYFSYIDFPVFNVADIYVTVGTFWMIILILFFYKEEELDFKAQRAVRQHSSMTDIKEK